MEKAATSGAQEIIEQLLVARGLATQEARERWLAPNYQRDLHDPWRLTDMDKAVARIVQAIEEGESMVVYGDYDIDGITASAVMMEAITALGGSVASYIPDRFEEGYGINIEALQSLKDQGVGLVISVDCGVTSVAEAAWARANGLDLIITDHHAVPEQIPEAVAVINPKRPGDQYPFKDLAGVGVAFKVVQALQSVFFSLSLQHSLRGVVTESKGAVPNGREGQRSSTRSDNKGKRLELGQEKWLLDLVALGTVCDVVALVGENRVLASYGLQVMKKTRRVGLRALAEVGGVKLADLTSYHLGFVLGPRMNAAGRLEHAARSLELMQTVDVGRAAQIAGELDDLNARRRADQDRIFAEADKLATAYATDPVLVLADAGWSHGVVGIVASKLMEKWRKPTVVLQILGDTAKGSARSIGAYDMIGGFWAVSEHFTKFGGHYFAAGCTLPTSKINSLRDALNAHYLSLNLATNEAIHAHAELELDDPAVVDWDLWALLEQLEPHGNGNPRPLFATGGLELVTVRQIGKDGKHYKLCLQSADGHTLDAVAFGMAERLPNLAPGRQVKIWYHLGRNDWQGQSSLQYVVSHLEFE